MPTYFKKILIVDKSDTDRFILKKLLEKNELAEEVIEAVSGMQALDILTSVGTKQDELPELIFLEVNMNSISGFQLLDILAKLSNDFIGRFRVVMMSTMNDPADRKHAFQYGCVISFYAKPFTDDSLLQLADRLRQSEAG